MRESNGAAIIGGGLAGLSAAEALARHHGDCLRDHASGIETVDGGAARARLSILRRAKPSTTVSMSRWVAVRI